MPSPNLSYYGLPALPIIYSMSYGLSSTHLPYSGLYIYVPLMITVCAGRFTPQASVAVDTNTLIWLSAYNYSTSNLSFLSRPALWMPIPYGNKSFKSWLLACLASYCKISLLMLSPDPPRNLWISSLAIAMSLIILAVLTVSFLEWTNTSI
jgi:hypothetical protein